LDLQRDEFDEYNYNLITGFDWDEDDLGELYSVIGGTYFRENAFMDDETEDGETQVEDDDDEDEDEDDEAEDDEDGETQVEDEDDMDVVDGEDVETQVKDDEDKDEDDEAEADEDKDEETEMRYTICNTLVAYIKNTNIRA
jgi:hypothetical protein